MSEKYVEVNGVRVVEDWPRRIAAAQEIRTYTIGGKEFPPYSLRRGTG